jgi:hypothetical protein
VRALGQAKALLHQYQSGSSPAARARRSRWAAAAAHEATDGPRAYIRRAPDLSGPWSSRTGTTADTPPRSMVRLTSTGGVPVAQIHRRNGSSRRAASRKRPSAWPSQHRGGCRLALPRSLSELESKRVHRPGVSVLRAPDDGREEGLVMSGTTMPMDIERRVFRARHPVNPVAEPVTRSRVAGLSRTAVARDRDPCSAS